MTNQIERCAIWPDSQANRRMVSTVAIEIESPRVGGKYIIDGLMESLLFHGISDSERARLTTWLVNQRVQGVAAPVVTAEVLDNIKTKPPLPIHERAERLLQFIAGQTKTIGNPVFVLPDTLEAYAWSESTEWEEVDYLLDYLKEKDWIRGEGFQFGGIEHGSITVEGYSRIAEQIANAGSLQAFVAMWFDDSMNDAYEKGIKPAIEAAGYQPMRIDQKPDVKKIDDEIIAEIRRSRFLVADFTQHEKEARGGVYFEAGFAEGLGLPVIYTCRKNLVENLHFDTRQYAHIVWETSDELREGLLNRIRARIV